MRAYEKMRRLSAMKKMRNVRRVIFIVCRNLNEDLVVAIVGKKHILEYKAQE